MDGMNFRATELMDQGTAENWLHYSSIWRNILTHVLGWPAERVGEFIEAKKGEMEDSFRDPFAAFGFFYDPPTHDLFGLILGNGLHERVKRCQSDAANSFLIFQRLVEAISGGLGHWEMDKEGFDWELARQRYQSERRKIEDWLSTLDER